MKSAHRHELETNALAVRLEHAIDRFRPYAPTVAGIIVAIVVIMFIWSYVSGSSGARQTAAWDSYHQTVVAVQPDLEQLRQTAEEYPGTQVQEWADATWADGQVHRASRQYLYDRAAANEALNRATSAYQRILQTSDDDRLHSRAHLGLARIYEMQNQLEKAREEYLKVEGAFQVYAKQQAERLEDPDAKQAYAWLSEAQAPRPRAPAGPGTPGQQPEFSPGDIPLPGGEATSPQETTGEKGDNFENLLKGMDLGFPTAEEPAAETPAAPTDSQEAAPPAEASDTNESPATEELSPVESPADEGAPTDAADAAAPASDEPAADSK